MFGNFFQLDFGAVAVCVLTPAAMVFAWATARAIRRLSEGLGDVQAQAWDISHKVEMLSFEQEDLSEQCRVLIEQGRAAEERRQAFKAKMAAAKAAKAG